MATKHKSLSADVANETDWHVESDLNTLLEAKKIEKDPKRMAAVSKLAKAKMLSMASVAQEGTDES
ncbi:MULTISPECIES: hypothetical protein [Giesbergeria]|uniref:Uncharacterized protein n=1 Tax=Giesbergeria sinuosa TaxID=80883 RepID=A0ABV9QF70_9BURK